MDPETSKKLADLEAERDALVASFPLGTSPGKIANKCSRGQGIELSHFETNSSTFEGATAKSNHATSSPPKAYESTDPRYQIDIDGANVTQKHRAATPDTTTQILDKANDIVKNHIKLLNSYNEIKDVGQTLLGLIAEHRDAKLLDIMEEFDISPND